MNISEISLGIAEGRYTSEELTIKALSYIIDNDIGGKKLNTVGEINPDAVFEARARDKEIREACLKGPLHGIPILIKDNIDVKGLHTTAGSMALSDLIADSDSTVAARLKSAGAVIIGKANMSEFAYWMAEGMPSGYSSLGGQVIQAYNKAFNPSGSSSGSAVAVSARFVPVSIGSETFGSLMAPAIANAIVAIKPTVGLVPRTGILPLSSTMDSAGPMANTVEDCAYILDAIAGFDPEDAATYDAPVCDYAESLVNDLTGMRIGIYTEPKEALTDKIRGAHDRLKSMIEEAGGESVDIEPDESPIPYMEIITSEFKNGINRYLASHNSACRSLSDIIDYNLAHPDQCLRYGQSRLIASQNTSGYLKEAEYLKQITTSRREAGKRLDDMMDKYSLCGIVKTCCVRSNIPAVRTSCSIAIPAVRFNAGKREPVSYMIMGKPYSECDLIRIAYTLQERLKLVNRPSWTGKTVWD